MSHALIIDDNMVVGRAIQNRLTAFGFDSFDHTWTEQQALEAAARRQPDLIVVGDHVCGGSPLEVARELASASQAPVLAVRTDRVLVQHCLAAEAKVDGPFALSELDSALATTQAVG